MKRTEFENYLKNQSSLKWKNYYHDIVDTLESKNKLFVIIKDHDHYRGILLDQINKEGEIVSESDQTMILTKDEWENERQGVLKKLSDYYHHTDPAINEKLENSEESSHQAYEGSSQITEEKDNNEKPSEGMDYDKAKGIN
jgi:hypothetical protein